MKLALVNTKGKVIKVIDISGGGGGSSNVECVEADFSFDYSRRVFDNTKMSHGYSELELLLKTNAFVFLSLVITSVDTHNVIFDYKSVMCRMTLHSYTNSDDTEVIRGCGTVSNGNGSFAFIEFSIDEEDKPSIAVTYY